MTTWTFYNADMIYFVQMRGKNSHGQREQEIFPVSEIFKCLNLKKGLQTGF